MDVETRSGLTKLLGLVRQPVALRWSAKAGHDLPREVGKSRFCEKLDRATRGEAFYATLEEEECRGGAKYCGLRDAGSDWPAGMRTGEFLVARGIYKSVAAVQRAWHRNLAIEPGLFKALLFAPLASAGFEPDVVFVPCNARQAMELLHANAYDSGAGAVGADAAPICSSMAAVPYLTGKVTYGFGDVGSRGHMSVGESEVMVSTPGSELARIVSNLEQMRSKKAFGAESG
jgi:uncharacterized protein (DUF169 family)